jgi:L-glutamine-phosphate cytidylyltransferase
MRGIILAAGKGSRISSISDGIPKSFLKIGSKTIIDHQLESLRNIGLKEIVIVTGYMSHYFEEKYGGCKDIRLIYNPFYSRCNVLGTVWFARDFLSDGFFFLHADTYFDHVIMQDLAQSKKDFSLSVELKDTVSEDMKVRIENGKIIQINKEMECSTADGEFVGIAKISKNIANEVINKIDTCIKNVENLDAYFEIVIQELINDGLEISPLDTKKQFSIEIDFPDDYAKAVEVLGNRL